MDEPVDDDVVTVASQHDASAQRHGQSMRPIHVLVGIEIRDAQEAFAPGDAGVGQFASVVLGSIVTS